MVEPRLTLGRLVATPTVIAEVDSTELIDCIRRHLSGDYGFTCKADAALNREAIREGCGRVMSEYRLADGSRLWISTDGIGTSEHHTCAMRPSDY